MKLDKPDPYPLWIRVKYHGLSWLEDAIMAACIYEISSIYPLDEIAEAWQHRIDDDLLFGNNFVRMTPYDMEQRRILRRSHNETRIAR